MWLLRKVFCCVRSGILALSMVSFHWFECARDGCWHTFNFVGDIKSDQRFAIRICCEIH